MTLPSLLGILTLFIGAPAVFIALMIYPRLKRPFLTVMVFATCIIAKPFYMEVFFVPYRGVDRGFAVTVPDLFFFGFFLWILAGRTGKRIVWLPYNTTLWILLIGVSILSLIESRIPYYGLFTLHKFFRGYVLYWVTVNLIRDREDLMAVLDGVMAAVLFQTWIVFWDKYVTHKVVSRSVGLFPHPNSLAMYVQLIIPIILALFLEGGLSKMRNLLAPLAVLGGLVCVIFSKSRASLAISSASLAMVVGISILSNPTKRKVAIALAGFVIVDIMGAIAAPKIIERFEKAPKASALTREYFNDAAVAMANDNLFGTGLNAYSWVLGNTEYYWFVYPDALQEEDDLEEFRESKEGQSRLGTAHHIYYLFAAETGWPGMVVFIMFVARYYLHNLVLLFRERDYYLRALLLGLLIGFSTLHLQGLLEWIFRQTQVFYIFCILSGTMVSIGLMRRRAHA